jgi:hypothetical protein
VLILRRTAKDYMAAFNEIKMPLQNVTDHDVIDHVEHGNNNN